MIGRLTSKRTSPITDAFSKADAQSVRVGTELTFPIASTSGEEKSYGETITDRDDDPDAELSDRAGGRRHDVDARLSRARRSANWPVLANVSRK